jgi:hypothetical protein
MKAIKNTKKTASSPAPRAMKAIEAPQEGDVILRQTKTLEM